MDQKQDLQENQPDSGQETERDKTFAVVRKGAKWGMIVGFVIAQIFISTHSPLGFYTGNMGLVYLTCIGLGTGVGALFAWLATMTPDYE